MKLWVCMNMLMRCREHIRVMHRAIHLEVISEKTRLACRGGHPEFLTLAEKLLAQ